MIGRCAAYSSRWPDWDRSTRGVPIYTDEYGLFDKRGVVDGIRPYGKKNRKPRAQNFANPQPRTAYCRGIYDWARDRGYPVNSVSLIRMGQRVIDRNMPPPCPPRR